MDRRGFLLAGTGAIAGLSGCLGVVASDPFDVGMTSNAFVPRDPIDVPRDAPSWVPRGVPTHSAAVGERVVWENTGSRNHTVTAATPDHGTAEELLGVDHSHGEHDHDGTGSHDDHEETTESHADHEHDHEETTESHADHEHDHEETTAEDHADHDHSHESGDASGGAEEAPYRLPEGAAYFASGGFESELAAVRSFIDEVGGGGPILPGEQFEYTFETPGWYHYYCIPHLAAGMYGTIYVE